MTQNATLWPRVEALLANVQKPARYIGCEDGAQVPSYGPETVSWLLFTPTRTKWACPTKACRSSTSC